MWVRKGVSRGAGVWPEEASIGMRKRRWAAEHAQARQWQRRRDPELRSGSGQRVSSWHWGRMGGAGHRHDWPAALGQGEPLTVQTVLGAVLERRGGCAGGRGLALPFAGRGLGDRD